MIGSEQFTTPRNDDRSVRASASPRTFAARKLYAKFGNQERVARCSVTASVHSEGVRTQ